MPEIDRRVIGLHWVVLGTGILLTILVVFVPTPWNAVVVGASVLAFTVAVYFRGSPRAATSATLPTKEIRVTDGKHEAVLTPLGLEMMVGGNSRIGLNVEADGTARLRLTDAKGKRRVGLAVIRDRAAGLGITGADGKQRVWLEVEPDGTPSLSLDDGSGHERRITATSG